MSYDISFRVKVEGADRYIDTGYGDANITWNLRKMIEVSTGLPWYNEANNGLVKDVMPSIVKGYSELVNHPQKYKQYESPNGWGTVDGLRGFFRDIMDGWESLLKDDEELADYVFFWIS